MSAPSFIRVPATGEAKHQLALLHGNGMCGAFYEPLAQVLSGHHIASSLFDLPGFGDSPPAENVGWAGLLDQLAPRVQAQIGPRGILMGHSLGGLVSLLLAPRLSLGALVLMEPGIIPWRSVARVAAALYRRQDGSQAQAFSNRGPWFWRLHAPALYPQAMKDLVAKTRTKTDPATMAALHGQIGDYYPLPFSEVRVPTLVMRGASSGPAMALGQRWVVDRIEQATPCTIPRAGHWLANEQDARIARQIADFLAEVRPEARGASGAGARP